MAVLFISHASKDDALVSALARWLKDNGFTDIFVDQHSIQGGDKWRDELKKSAGAARVVICFVSPNWLASDQCMGEFRAAWYMGKRLIPLFLLPPGANLDDKQKKSLAEVMAEDQGVDLWSCVQDGKFNLVAETEVTDRIKAGLRAAGALSQVGLDPKAFDIDQELRPTPFPGLSAFGDDDADAALFYGRNREIAQTLEELRAMRATSDQRPLMILGASGSGKSSLLRAGIVPRLRRETPAWLPLRAFRPGADPLLNFAECLARTLADYGHQEAQGVIRDRLMREWTTAERDEKRELTAAGLARLETALEAEGELLRKAANRPSATILVSIDQAEEIARSEGDSGDALADYLKLALAAQKSSWRLAFTIRTDSFAELQRHRRFQNLEARGYDLRTLPVFLFNDVIVDPAKRYGVEIDPNLAYALMEGAPKEDALPLLAFAMQRLWEHYAGAKALTAAQFENIGGLSGLIEGAAERALRSMDPELDAPLPAGGLPKRLDELGARTFVPPLAQINDQGATIRRVAAWDSFSEDQQELLDRFARWRLVVRKGGGSREVDAAISTVTDANLSLLSTERVAPQAPGGLKQLAHNLAFPPTPTPSPQGGGEKSGGGTVEVAHEALFREWGRLRDWLEPERARLEALRAVKAAARTWQRFEHNKAYLDHRDDRLKDALALTRHDGFSSQMEEEERAYLAACATAERVEKAARRRMKALVALSVCSAAAIVGLAYGGFLDPTYLETAYNRFQNSRREAGLRPGDVIRECSSACPEMVFIAAGKFMMGSKKGKGKDDERPQHEVTIGTILDGAYARPQHEVTIGAPLLVSKYEVTFEEWDACVKARDCSYKPDDSSWGRDRRPVINVSWKDIQQYIGWLRKTTGMDYRLLSEAEWEYAARAGSSTTYSWGDEIGTNRANCYGCGSQWDGKQTAPVGQFDANPFGLYDMHGNVWEWVEDCGHAYKPENNDGRAITAEDCSPRVLRGGSCCISPSFLRADYRGSGDPDNRDKYIGFRVGRSVSLPRTR